MSDPGGSNSLKEEVVSVVDNDNYVIIRGLGIGCCDAPNGRISI